MTRMRFIVFVVVAMIAVACSEPATGGDDASSHAATDGTTVIDDTALVVYSGRSEELVGPLIDQFTEETGIAVSVRYGGSTELATTLLAEGDSTEADVFFAQDPASLGAVSELLTQLDASILDRVPARFADSDGRWVGTSGRARVVIYDTEQVDAADLPQTLDDLVDPRWNGQMGVAPTNGSFLAFVAAMIESDGEDATLDWLERLAANQPVDFPSNSPIVAAADAGEVADAASLVMPAGAGILANSDQAESAKTFVEFLLSETAQTYFATETFEFPLVSGIEPPAGLPAIDEISTPAIDLSRLADHLERATDLVTEAGLL